MNAAQYRRYLKTSHWRRFKDRYFKRYRYECVVCHATKMLELHHLTYERLGKERLEDCVYCCRKCHQHITDGDFKLKRVVFDYPKGRKVVVCKNV